MTPDLTLSELDVIIAGCLAHTEHFITYLYDGHALCRICLRSWTVEEYAADTEACPGYRTYSGLEPVPGAEHRLSVGPVYDAAL